MGSQIENLSNEFSRLVCEYYSADQLSEVIAKNNTAEYSNGACATHDYFDANMIMAEAFKNIFDRDFIFYNEDEPETQQQNQDDTNVWNTAWSLSKYNEFAVIAI